GSATVVPTSARTSIAAAQTLTSDSLMRRADSARLASSLGRARASSQLTMRTSASGSCNSRGSTSRTMGAEERSASRAPMRRAASSARSIGRRLSRLSRVAISTRLVSIASRTRASVSFGSAAARADAESGSSAAARAAAHRSAGSALPRPANTSAGLGLAGADEAAGLRTRGMGYQLLQLLGNHGQRQYVGSASCAYQLPGHAPYHRGLLGLRNGYASPGSKRGHGFGPVVAHAGHQNAHQLRGRKMIQ